MLFIIHININIDLFQYLPVFNGVINNFTFYIVQSRPHGGSNARFMLNYFYYTALRSLNFFCRFVTILITIVFVLVFFFLFLFIRPLPFTLFLFLALIIFNNFTIFLLYVINKTRIQRFLLNVNMHIMQY